MSKNKVSYLIFIFISFYIDAQPRPLVRIMEKALRPGVLYDAFVQFRDKGELNCQDISDLNANLEKEFNYHAINRRKN